MSISYQCHHAQYCFCVGYQSCLKTSSFTNAVAPAVKIQVKKGDDIDVPKGRDVSLTCEVKNGFPTAKIEWKKDTTILKSKMTSPTTSVLDLKDVQPVNAGRYVCTGQNLAGTHSDDVIVTVKCKIVVRTAFIFIAL